MARGSGAATILDVAREAGVSRQTVTRALNGLPDVSAATRDRVVAAARLLRYRPNRAAQDLVRGRDVTLAFLVEDFHNPYYPELAAELSRCAAERGWNLVLGDVSLDPAQVRARLASLLARVDAIVLTGCRDGLVGQVPLDELRAGVLQVPLVMLDGPPDAPVDARVDIDHADGVRQALDHLRRTGRERVAMIDSAQLPGSQRTQAFRALLARDGARWADDPVVLADESPAAAGAAAEEVLRRWPTVDAVLVYNDVMATGVLKALARRGVEVPGRVAVVGTDGLALGALVTPELTTVAIDLQALAEQALELAAQVLAGGDGPDRAGDGGGRTSAGEEVGGRVRRVGVRLLVRESA